MSDKGLAKAGMCEFVVEAMEMFDLFQPSKFKSREGRWLG